MTLEEYMKLPYKFTAEPLPEDEGGGYYVQYVGFGIANAHGDGETVEEAVENARASLELTIQTMLEAGQEVPVPKSDESYSGQFRLRIPKTLHRKLSEQAEAEATSLNQLCASYLSEAIGRA